MKKTKKSVISSLFNLDSKWLRCSATVFDYMCLNVLFCLTCLPFLTIGVAKMSLYATLVNDHSGNQNTFWQTMSASSSTICKGVSSWKFGNCFNRGHFT